MSRPNLIVLVHSEPWCSAISRNFADFRQSWVLNVPALIDESFRCGGSAAIVEIPENSAFEFCVELAELANNSAQMRLFVVGDRRLLRWRPLLRAMDVAAWHWSLLQIPSLVQAVARHHAAVHPTSQSTESALWSDLPWPTAATDRHA